MDKKIIFVLIFLVAIFAGFYIFTVTNTVKDNDENTDEVSNSNNEVVTIGDVNNIKLYKTDFKYDNEKKEYAYVEIILTDEQISNLKTSIKNINLNKNVNATVYGQYKLVLDDKIIFFDSDNDYALYMGTNKEIKFSNEIKKIVATTNDKCSCCTTQNCMINLCKCAN